MDKNKKLFPQRLWELIHNEQYNFCLRWSQDGQRVYLNRNEFEQHYLKTSENQFHTQKAISFVRQMNIYGFRKVDDCYYENDHFKRNCPELLKNMVRRHSNRGFLFSSSNNNHHHHHHHHHLSHLTGGASNSQQSAINNSNVNGNNNLNGINNNTCTSSTTTTTTVMSSGGSIHNHNGHNFVPHLGQLDPANQSIQPLYRRQKAVATGSTALSQTGNQHHHLAELANSTNDHQQVLAQCYRDAAGGQLSAALAASLNATGVSHLPLAASTLYHRLAALNFEKQVAATAASTTFDSSSSSSPLLPASCATQESGGAASTSPGMKTAQPQVAHQALQQTLVGSLLQMNQQQQQHPQESSALLLQQNLVASLQQRAPCPNLFLESLACQLSSPANNSSCADLTGASQEHLLSPLELVVNHQATTQSQSISNLDLQQRQLELATGLSSRQSARRSSAGDFRGQLEQPQQQQSFIHHMLLNQNPQLHRLSNDNLLDSALEAEFEHDDLLTGEDFTRSSSLRGSSSCSSVEQGNLLSSGGQLPAAPPSQHQEDLSELVLDLARPSGARARRHDKPEEVVDEKEEEEDDDDDDDDDDDEEEE